MSSVKPFLGHPMLTQWGLRLLAVIGVLLIVWALDPNGSRQQRATPAQPSTDPAEAPSALTTDGLIRTLQARIKQNAQDEPAYVELASAYLQKVREEGDPSYYPKAEALLQQALAQQPNDFRALLQMGSLSLSRHDFGAALEWGKKAQALNPRYWLIYGVIGDAQVELGDYDAASDSFQQMVNLRPDLNSYARVSYIRELNGDVDGAIQAMQWAVGTGVANAENTNWTRVQLGHLYFNSGRLDAAEAQYRLALRFYPHYAHATAGLARVAAARGDYERAIQLYQDAIRVIPLPEYVIALGDVYQATGQTEKAKSQYDLVQVMQQLFRANGVDTDMEMALFQADHRSDPAAAVAQARQAYARRPSIHAADALAWCLYRAGAYTEAQKYSSEALRLGTQDALKLFHAGMIASRLGERTRAREYLSRALALNPYFSILYSTQARQLMEEL